MDDDRLQKRTDELKKSAADGGYALSADEELVRGLAAGLLKNADRYGMETCPCRLSEGGREDNLDIVCPCVYRDDDLAEHGACFCGLYVAGDGPKKPVPDRRPPLEARRTARQPGRPAASLAYPVYRCGVCGYLCANTHPPRVCPVCKAKAERFERFM